MGRRIVGGLVGFCFFWGWGAAPELGDIQQLGPLRLRMPQQQVDSALGRCDKEGNPLSEAANACWIKHRRYERHGVTLTFVSENGRTNWSVARFTASAPCRWKTPQKVGIGSTGSEVRQAYSGRIDTSTSSRRQIVVGSLYDGVVFRLDPQYRVESIFMGAAAE